MSTYLKIRKYGGPFLLIAITVTAVLSFFWLRGLGDGADPAPAPESENIASQAQMITRDFRHVETRMNRTIWIIEAAVAEMFEKRARLQRVKITYFDKQDRPIIITGRRGRIDLESLDAVLLGDVRVLSHDGAVLKTRQLEWDNEDQILLAPWPVKIRSGGFAVRGRRMIVMVAEDRVRIIGAVRATTNTIEGFFEPST